MTATSKSELGALFKEKYEAVSGHVHFARRQADAVKIVRDILRENELSKPVLGPLPGMLAQALNKFFKSSGIIPVDIDLNSPMVQNEINQADVGLSQCEFGIAFTGTVVEVTTEDAYRLVSSLPGTHIAFVSAHSIVPGLDEAGTLLREIYQKTGNCNVTFLSGPSRTADIEMKLFLGVHGPQASHVIVYNW